MVKIDSLKWGLIVVGGRKHRSDVVILPDGEVRRRRGLLSRLFGHTFKKAEFERLAETGAEIIVVGLGVKSAARVSVEAKQYAEGAGLELIALPSPEVVTMFNRLVDSGKKAAAVIHITC
ncbi:MTH938/NDUFAF3 family protein [Chloroflexota bacterium]